LDQLLGIESVPGAFVSKVEPDSPAAVAGLATCDVIAALNGNGLRTFINQQAFRAMARESAMFADALLAVWKFDPPTESYHSAIADFVLPAELGAREGLATGFAVIVVDVSEASPAAAAGIKRWDFIDRVDGELVSNMRNVIELDKRVNDALSHNGKVRLTLGRWKPVAGSSEGDFAGTMRDVIVTARKSRSGP
jgi:S1-C subfamily serine protease